MPKKKVLYVAHSSPEVYRAVRDAAPDDVEIITLETSDEAERMAKIAECEVVIQASMSFPKALVDSARNLRLVLHEGVGYQDTLDVPALRARGIRIALTPEGTIVAVAEHAIMMMIGAFKHVIYADSETRAGHFPRTELRAKCRLISESTVGYIGMGRIAQAVAERLKPFNAKGVYFDTATPLTAAREAELGVRRVGFDELLRTSDIVSVHLPLTPQTRGMIDAAAIAKMQPDAVLIATSRGGIVDEMALYEAMKAGHLLGAGIDVFEQEPLPAGQPLSTLPNVILSPHLAGSTRDAITLKMKAIFDNYRKFYGGEPLNNEVAL
jgi:phosphoglycerate dehydrogenase-like enzyme